MAQAANPDLEAWLRALVAPAALTELGALGLCVGLAWLLTRLLGSGLGQGGHKSVLFGRRTFDGVLFPLVLLGLAMLARALLMRWLPLAVFKIAIPVLLALLAIRLAVKVLQAAFQQTPLVLRLERSISWLAWGAMVLWVSGLLPLLLDELDQISWKMGEARMSLRTLIEGGLTAALMLVLALWISAVIEARLLRSASGGELSLRLALSNATRALLVFIGLLFALSALGMDLTALSVLGGALGVGLGFGLQKLAASYISGFVILAERSLRIGDNVRLDNFEGRITRINARYSVILSLTGREAIVPNEMLITSRVENLSLANEQVWQSTVVSVAYDSDVNLVMRLLREAALNQPRVLREPEPSVALSAFGTDGLEFTVGYWMADPENGNLNLRSLVNLDILRLLRENGIAIPFPQRVVHTRPA
ncbi:MAG: mechanosensitive ion channel [Rhodoferax sp.]|nr:mechanosensitive ion channel [Rhodoferax sp.]